MLNAPVVNDLNVESPIAIFAPFTLLAVLGIVSRPIFKFM